MIERQAWPLPQYNKYRIHQALMREKKIRLKNPEKENSAQPTQPFLLPLPNLFVSLRT
jgi:hypothetical protein